VRAWIEATLRPLPQPPPVVWRLPAELIAKEVRAHRATFPSTSTAELVARTLNDYRSRSGARWHFVLPDLKAVLAEFASS
jgi:hypothetical protein